MKTLQVTIPKPCHENWNKMSLQEQGRFCSKCCKTVMDFSIKSPEEVQQILLEHNHEKLCGRFRNDQMAKPVKLRISYQSIGSHLSAAQIFFVALLFAFGTSLFSCTSPKDDVVGEMELVGLDSITSETTIDSAAAVSIESDTIIEYATVGALVAYSPDEEIKEPIEDSVVLLPEVEVSDSSIPLNSSFTTGLIAKPKTEPISCFTLGGIEVSVQQPEFFDSVPDSAADIRSNEDKVLLPSAEQIAVYPNPSQGIVNLQFNLAEEKNVQAELMDMSGKLIRIVIPSQVMSAEEEKEMQFDLGDLTPGTYMVRIVIGEEVIVKRVVKI